MKSRLATSLHRIAKTALGAALAAGWCFMIATPAAASVTIEFTFGAFGDVPSGSVGVLVADRDGNGFTDLANASAENSPLVAGQAIRGSDDLVVGVVRATGGSEWGGGVGFAETFAGIDYLGLGLAPGDSLRFYWFPGITGSRASLFAGQPFRSFRSEDVGVSGGTIGFRLPTDGGVYRLCRLTTALGGNLDANDLGASGESGTGTTPGHDDALITRGFLTPGSIPLEPDETPAAYEYGQEGSYFGLLRSDLRGADEIALEGSLSATISHNRKSGAGALSMTILYQGVRYAAKSPIEPDGSATITLTKAGPLPLPLTLTTQMVDTPSGRKIAGQMTGDGQTTRFGAFQLSFHPRNQPAAQAGSYTLALPFDSGADFSLQPGGTGIGLGYLSTAGSMKTLLVLGDGTKASALLLLSPDGELMFYQPLYRRDALGWIGGVMAFRDSAGIGQADGLLHWKKGNAPGEALYPGGFDLQQKAVVSGYLSPNANAGERILAEIPDGESNAFLNLTGGNIPAIPGKPLTWDNRNRIAPSSPSAGEKLIVAADPRSGIVTGRFQDAATGQSVSFTGVAMQSQGLVVGHFIGQQQTGALLIDSAGFAALFAERLDDAGASPLPHLGILDFGAAGIDGGFSEVGIRIGNSGTGNLVFTRPPAIDPGGSDFGISASSLALIPPGGSRLLRVRFDPSAEGTASADLILSTNDEGTGDLIIHLTGRGIPGSQRGDWERTGPDSIVSPSETLSQLNATQVPYDSTSQFGGYTGLIYRDAFLDIPSGTASFVVTHNRKTGIGSASGTLTVENLRIIVRGTFLPDGTFGGTLTGPGASNFTLQMALAKTSDSDSTTATSSGKLQLVGQIQNLVSGDTYRFAADRSGWTKGNPAPYAGAHTILLPLDDERGSGFPGGTGAGTLGLSTTGIAIVKAYLADNTPFTWAGRFSDAGQLSIYHPLDRSRPVPSLIAGVVTFREIPGISVLDGELYWRRVANRRAAQFSDGFEFWQPLIGGPYQPPARGEFALSGLLPGTGNAALTLQGAGIDETFACEWNTLNQILPTPMTDELLLVRLDLRSGLFAGFRKDRQKGGLNLAFRGALYQLQDTAAGYWYFHQGHTGQITLSPVTPP